MKLYRYRLLKFGNWELFLDEFLVLKETEKGYRIEILKEEDFYRKEDQKNNRFVLKEGKKCFARTTKEKAFEDLYLRKKAYLNYAEINLKRAEESLDFVNDMRRKVYNEI
jgi:hypothetical protein